MARKKTNAPKPEAVEAVKTEVVPEVSVEAKVEPKVEAPKVAPVVPEEPKPTYKKTRRGGAGKKKAAQQAVLVAKTAPPNASQLAIVAKVEKALKSLPRGDVNSENRTLMRQLLKELDDKLMADRVKQPKSKRASNQVKQELEELIEVPEFADQVPMKEQEYKDILAWEEFAAFRVIATEIKETVEKKLHVKVVPEMAVEKLRLRDAVARLKRVDPATLDINDISVRTLDLPADVMACMFQPMWISRRYEREHEVVIESSTGKGKGKGVPRSLLIAGTDMQLDACCMDLKNLDFSYTKTISLDGRVMGSVIGPGGQNARALERDCDVFLNTSRDTPNEVTIYGAEAGVKMALEKIEAKKEEFARLGETETMKAEADKARALLTETGRAKVKEIEALTDTTINVRVPNEYTAEVIFRGRDLVIIGTAKKMVASYMETLMSKLAVGEPDLVTKMFRTQELNQQYLKLKEQSGLVFMRKDNGVVVVGDAAAVPDVVAELENMIERAGYEPVNVTIMREQQRAFNDDNKYMIADKSGCHVEVRRRDGEIYIMLKGSPEQQTKAKTLIDEIIRKEGTVETIPLSNAVILALISSQGAKIRDIEDLCNVSLNLDRTALQVTVVGGERELKKVRKMLEDMEAAEASVMTKEVAVNAEDIPRVIGTRGATIKQIRELGVQVQVDDAKNIVELRGQADAIERAEEFITELCSRAVDTEADDFGDWTFAPVAPVEVKKPAPQKPREVNLASEDLFPSLGAAAKTTKLTGKRRGAAWGKTAPVEKDENVPISNEIELAPRDLDEVAVGNGL